VTDDWEPLIADLELEPWDEIECHMTDQLCDSLASRHYSNPLMGGLIHPLGRALSNRAADIQSLISEDLGQ
jgi:hypothetical protein